MGGRKRSVFFQLCMPKLIGKKKRKEKKRGYPKLMKLTNLHPNNLPLNIVAEERRV